MPEILALVDETPDITLGEIAAHLDAGHGLTVAPRRSGGCSTGTA